MNWLSTGYDGFDQDKQASKEIYQIPDTFFVKKFSEGAAIFLDSKPAVVYEHFIWVYGKPMRVTCLGDNCPPCRKQNQPKRTGYNSVIDPGEWINKKGEKLSHALKFFAGTQQTQTKLKRRNVGENGLVGKHFKIPRDKDNSPACGDDFIDMGTVDIQALLPLVTYRGRKLVEMYEESRTKKETKETLVRLLQVKLDGDGDIIPAIYPFNYEELLKPKSEAAMETIMRGYSSQTYGGNSNSNDNIPF